MEGRLYQTDAGGATLRSALHHRFHQLTAHPSILDRWIHRNRPNAGYDGPFVHAIAPQDPAFFFGNHAIQSRTGKHHSEEPHRNLHGREVGRKGMGPVNVTEGVEADLSTERRVFWLGLPDG